MATPPFERTHCACKDCQACCKKPGYCLPGDVEAIAALRDETLVEALENFRPGKGATVMNSHTGQVFRIRTVVPATSPSGHCVFQDGEGRCTVHEASPFGCRFMDVHMDVFEANARSTWGLERIWKNGSYQALVDCLESIETARQERADAEAHAYAKRRARR